VITSPTAHPTKLTSDFDILPLEDVQPQWNALIASDPAASLYHREAWLEVLRRAFAVHPLVAIVGDRDSIEAGCLFATRGIPLRRRLVSLPFTDFCPPLAIGGGAREDLLRRLASAPLSSANFEIRGVAASSPWQVLDHFRHWQLDLSRTFGAIVKDAEHGARRNIRRALDAGVTIERSVDIAAIRAFFKLQLENRRRLGVPSQSMQFFKIVHEVFAARESIEVWLASHLGRYVAAVVVLRDGDVLHARWSARSINGQAGAGHLIYMSIAESWAQRARILDLGRTDFRNIGLARFKRQLGADSMPLPYSYLPQIPAVTSAEHLSGLWAVASEVWRNLPLSVTHALGSLTYRYLA
jgi:hypothetical protein